VKPCQLFPPCLRLSFAHGRVCSGVLKRPDNTTIAGQSIDLRPQERGLGGSPPANDAVSGATMRDHDNLAEAGELPTSMHTAAMLHARCNTRRRGGEPAVSSDSQGPMSPTYQASANAGASTRQAIFGTLPHSSGCWPQRRLPSQNSALTALPVGCLDRAVAVSRPATQIDRTRSPGIGCLDCELALLRRRLRHGEEKMRRQEREWRLEEMGRKETHDEGTQYRLTVTRNNDRAKGSYI
jgi:hypothetical protein